MKHLWQSLPSIAHVQRIAHSLKHWTGRDLIPETPVTEPDRDDFPAWFADQIFHAPFVLVSHGTESDPVLNYGNQAALTLWEMSWDELTHTPSRLTAETPNRQERDRLLATVTRNGFIDDYSGIRISRSGHRFRILQATVWNLLDDPGNYAGQAAMFSDWDSL
jgi:hypothetical protein